MAKNRGNRVNIKPIDEVIPEEVRVAAEDLFDEPVVLTTDGGEVEEIIDSLQNEKQEVSILAEVIGCFKLNVREEPDENASVYKVLNKGDKVLIHPDESTPEGWVKLTNGYCMSKFIKEIN